MFQNWGSLRRKIFWLGSLELENSQIECEDYKFSEMQKQFFFSALGGMSNDF